METRRPATQLMRARLLKKKKIWRDGEEEGAGGEGESFMGVGGCRKPERGAMARMKNAKKRGLMPLKR